MDDNSKNVPLPDPIGMLLGSNEATRRLTAAIWTATPVPCLCGQDHDADEAID